jgi:hypothetical protein
MDGKINFRPLPIALTAILPVLVGLVDIILRYTIAKIMGQASISIAGITNKVMWIVQPDGNSYLSTERYVMNDHLWLFATLYIVLLFLIGVFLSKRFKRKDFASAFPLSLHDT